MEELINGLVTKVGLSKDMAQKVVAFLQEHADDVPKWLASAGVSESLAGRLPGGLGNALGGILGKKD
jgi:hypothetical protein